MQTTFSPLFFAVHFLLIQLSFCAVRKSISPKVCDEYELVEHKFKCGPRGYPLNYGLRNCRVFTNDETLKKFTDEGKQFVECSTKCLIKAMLNISEFSTSCAQLQSEAFKSHVDCYLNCDFCKVCKTEKVALMSSYDWTDFLSFAAAQQVFSIIRKCGVLGCFKFFQF